MQQALEWSTNQSSTNQAVNQLVSLLNHYRNGDSISSLDGALNPTRITAKFIRKVKKEFKIGLLIVLTIEYAFILVDVNRGTLV